MFLNVITRIESCLQRLPGSQLTQTIKIQLQFDNLINYFKSITQHRI